MTLFALCPESASMKRLEYKCRFNHLGVLIFLTLLCNYSSYGNPRRSTTANSLWKMSNNSVENKNNVKLIHTSENNLESSSFSGFTQMYSNPHPAEGKLPPVVLPEKLLNSTNEENIFGMTTPWIRRSQTFTRSSPPPLNDMNTEPNYIFSTPPGDRYTTPTEKYNYQQHSIQKKPGVLSDFLYSPSPSNRAYYDSSYKISDEFKKYTNNPTSENIQGRTFSPQTIPLEYNEKKVWPKQPSNHQESGFTSRMLSLARSLSDPKDELKSRLQSKPVSDAILEKKSEHQSPQAITRNTFIPTHLKTASTTSRESRETKPKPFIKKKYRKYMLPLLIAYKLKFLTLIPLLMGGLVMIVGSTGLAGFFFALFAAVMGLKSKGVSH